ncbi:MAG: Gldg family protein [Clostridia bacterium]|nr:Gldg family protein [Clostridia bacterium]
MINKQEKADNSQLSADSEAIYIRKSPKKLTVITAVVLLAVVVFNILFSVIGDRQMFYIDLSQTLYKSGKTNMYTLSDDCKDMIADRVIPMIDQTNEERAARGEDPIKLNIVFCSDRDVLEDNELTRYVSYTARAIAKRFPDHVSVQYIDISTNPSSVQKYKVNSAATLYNSDVIVEFGSEYLVQGVNSFYYTESTADKPWAYNGEQRLTAMIMSVTRVESPICCITSNHGESLFDGNGNVKEEYSTFISLIESAGYTVQILDLENEDIPENCRMIITFDPSEDYKAFGELDEGEVSEIEKLDKYLDQSKSFFFICNPDTPKLPSLEEYLEEWGVSVNRDENSENYVIEDQINCTNGGVGSVVVGNYATAGLGATLTEDMRKSAYPAKVIFGNSTAIAPADNYVRRYAAATETTDEYVYYSYYKNGVVRTMLDVFTTYNTASALTNGEVYEIATDSNLFKLMTISQESKQIQETNLTSVTKSSYVLALASTDFLTNEVLDSKSYGNTDVLLSALRNTGNETVATDLSLKGLYVYEIKDEAAYKDCNTSAWLYCLVLIPPVLVFSAGVVITIRRKYR